MSIPISQFITPPPTTPPTLPSWCPYICVELIFKQQGCELYSRLSILSQSWVGCIDRKEDSRGFLLVSQARVAGQK